MKYRCLIVDHDDTVVNSTATVHFPCFTEFLRLNFPKAYSHGYTLEEYFIKNFEPGIVALFRDEVGLTDAQFKEEEAFWNDYVQTHIPESYPGMRELLWEQKKAGVLICVVSHSLSANILRDYRENGLPKPDAVFGWDCPPEKRKPSVWALEQIRDRFGLKKEEMLMLDDSKPGCDMAKSFGCRFAAAGWAFRIPQIESYLLRNSDRYFYTVEALRTYLEND